MGSKSSKNPAPIAAQVEAPTETQTEIPNIQTVSEKPLNNAVVFLKPHVCSNEAAETLVKDHLSSHSIQILSRQVIPAEVIEQKGMIDKHYGTIAANAYEIKPAQLIPTLRDSIKENFSEKFGQSISEVEANGGLVNLGDYLANNEDEGVESVFEQWQKNNDTLFKLAPGTYCAKMDNGMLVVNGFYGQLRQKYIAPGVELVVYKVQFDGEKVPWEEFRGSVIGATNPEKAVKGSLRQKFLESYEELGVSKPTMADNGVHASAGPIEALHERSIWLGVNVADDEFTKLMLSKGVKIDVITDLCNNKTVQLNGETGPAFDLLEDKNSDYVVDAAVALSQ
mmetsp:Transcript_15227/g.18837  ORF Transcript_15227/g.18837 Transcript_15227/m.18837 type:complete len:338 (+) Transcript_15227:178-1191(+)|eukprot:CAMPEP_0204829072 /NCGR_PEP_ID=MMETSP1346-20131115/7072_1 /ASSEMBLY_ACC=CAM_ASM_000771 /TAXON_ID=215587 /ORGANISM="Aplanochytrium stocchinoi, Strain GSBS06" /LENGTH=337 /DNA_ID=CAMNT_0051958573 /DNA_START=27 /DNA_END=1040 /DNA_ORIENTATION=-